MVFNNHACLHNEVRGIKLYGLGHWVGLYSASGDHIIALQSIVDIYLVSAPSQRQFSLRLDA